MTRWSLDAELRTLRAALVAQGKRIAKLEQERLGLRELWAGLTQLEERIARLDRRVGRLASEIARHRASGRRLPLSRAAQRLGVSRDHALRLARRHDLDLVDLREKGAAQALWTVDQTRLEDLLEARRTRPADIADPTGAVNGHPRSDP